VYIELLLEKHEAARCLAGWILPDVESCPLGDVPSEAGSLAMTMTDTHGRYA